MGLNLNGLKNFNKELASRSGSKTFLVQKDITEATDFRILPPLPDLNGNYFVEVVVWWINKKRYTSPETYGEPCPIQAEVDKALNGKDKDLKALASDKDVINKKSEFWIPGLQLEPVYDPKDKEEVIDFKVVDGKAKVLTCGPALMKRINKMVTSKVAQNGTPDGITDREQGRNLILSKTGVKLNTEYDAEVGDMWEFDESFYDPENIPNVAQMVSDSLRPDDYLEGVIRNYLYGEDMPEDPVKNKEEGDDKPAAKKPAGGKKSPETEALPKTTLKRKPVAPVQEEQEEELEEEEVEGDDLDMLDRNQLKVVLKNEGVQFKLYTTTSDEAIRDAIRKHRDAPVEEAKPVASAKTLVGGKKTPTKPAARNFMADLENLDN